tara:strand:- start:830 stop:1099 length:270 start_codon:yes stop_codon:yes gene_type:complete
MAEVLDNFEFKRRGRGPSYPYHEWFNGQIWKLEEWTDFDCKPTSLRSAMYAAAQKRNLELSTNIGTDTDGFAYVIVQAHVSKALDRVDE